MLWNQGGGGSGAGVVANTCTAGDFFSAVDGSGNFTCATPAGSGDVTAVGDCASGNCFDGTTGNSLQFEGATANGFETTLTATDPTADRTITMPNRSGQMALERTVNLYDYAACNGTDESTAIQSAITAACALGPGGTLYVPADSCFFATTLTGCSGLAIVGSDVTERAAYVTTQPHELVYTGTTVGLDFGGLAGVRLEGIRVQASNASFSSGTLLDIDGSSYVYLDRVNLVAPNLAGAATSKLLYANDVVGLWITGSIFDRGGYSIYGRALSSNYSNVVSIKDTVFYRAEVCSVMNPGDTWDVSSSWWQQQGAASDESYHWCHDTGICMRSLNFSGNMSVDQPASPTNAEFTFCGSGLNISGNFIGGGGTQDGILFDEACDGCSVTGNWFGFLDEALSFSGTGVTGSTIDVTGNGYTTVTSVTSSTRPTRSIMQEATNSYWNDPADIYLNVDTNANSGAGALVVGSNATSSSATHQYDFTEAYANWRRGNDLRFYETDDTNYVQLSAPTLSGDYTLTLPVDDGNSNEVLATNGSGTLSWASNIATATALASNPSDCASDTYATTIAASGNLTCASITNASTTGTATNTPSTLVLRDGSGNFAAGTVTAALTGNASTATALAANPADCSADTYATTIAASGALTCATVTNAGLAGSIAVSKTLATGGAGIDINTNDFVTDSSETSFLANSTSLPGTCGEGAVYQDTDSGGTETYVCTAANTWTKTIAATDNVATATALASNPSDCGADTYATTIAASGNLTCSTVSSAGIADGAIVNADINASAAIALSKLANMSTDRLLGRDTASSGAIEELTVGGGIEFTGSGGIQRSAFSGGDVTASAGSATLAIGADKITEAMLKAVDSPSDEECLTYESTGGDFEWQSCGSGGSGISGIAADSGGTTTGSTVTLTGGAGVTTTRSSDTVTVATASTEQDFLAQSASLSCAGTTPGKLIVDTTTQTLSYCPTGSTTTKYAALGNDSGQATLLSSVNCSAGVITASDGTPSCLTASSTPEFISRVMTAGATLGNYAVVMADGSDDDEVIEATTSTTQILGCSQDSDGTTSTNPVEVAVAGIARCKADTTVTAGSLVKLGATGEFSLATTADKTWGRAVTDDDGAGSAYILLFDGAEGTIDHALDLWTSIPDLTSNTLSIINANPTVSMTSTGTLNGVNFAPTFTTSGIGVLTGFNFQPTYSHSSLVSQLYGFNMEGTYTSTDASAALAASIMRNDATYTSSTANAEPFSSLISVDDKPAISNTTATTSTSTPTSYITIRHDPVISINDANGATGGLAAMTLTNDIGLTMSGTYTETSGTLAVTNRVGFQYNEVTNTSTATAITNNIGVDIAALGAAGATNNIGHRNADTTVYTPCVDDISSNTDYMVAKSACTAINLTAGGTRNFTGGTDQIADGYDGQIIYLFFTGSNSVAIEDGDNVNLGTGGTATLSASDTLTLLFSSTSGEWMEIARSNN